MTVDQLDNLLPNAGQVRAKLDEDLRGDALTLADEAEQDVLGADVIVSELQRLAEAELEDLLGARGKGDVPAGRLLSLADDLLDLGTHRLERDPERFQRLRGDAFALVDQAEQNVLGADVIVLEEACFLLGQHHDPSRTVGKPFEHRCSLAFLSVLFAALLN